MMKRLRSGSLCCLLLLASPLLAADYRAQPLKEPPPADQLSAEIAASLSSEGIRILRGSKTVYCDIWLCKQWPVRSPFQPSSEVLYPFHPGQLVGVARYARKGSDFRDQEIAKGVYTLRYALQPMDGNHEGTFPTRDFLLLVRAADDRKAQPMEYETLAEKSAEAVESNHPGLLCMLRVTKTPAHFPAMRHDEEKDWWILELRGHANAGGQPAELPIDLVVVGIAEE